MRKSDNVLAGFGLMAMALFPWSGWAVTRYVALEGGAIPPYTNLASAATTIQTAIDVAASGDEILVSPGVYLISQELYIPPEKALTLRSTQSRAAIIDAQSLCRGILVDGTNSLIEGFTVRNGSALSHYGGGIYLSRASTVRDCLVVSNRAWGAGGIMINACEGVVENSTIEYNYGSYFGGGLIFYARATGLVNHCIIRGNVASNHAGGVSFQGGGTVSNSWIVDNVASNSYAGVQLENGGTIVNSVLAGNRARFLIGGLYSEKGTVVHCTIVGNEAAVEYGGAFLSRSTSWNNMVYFNVAPSNNDAYATLSVVGNCCASDPLGGSNFTNPPTFVNLATRDFHLAEGSSGIDAGAADPAVASDYDGIPRPQAGVAGGVARYDVGAFEFILVLNQYFSATQQMIGYAKKDWSFMTAWNLASGAFLVGPDWYNGNSTLNYTLTYQEWIALFLYDDGTAQTRELRWSYRQSHVQ